jgi:hypothetical protein
VVLVDNLGLRRPPLEVSRELERDRAPNPGESGSNNLMRINRVGKASDNLKRGEARFAGELCWVAMKEDVHMPQLHPICAFKFLTSPHIDVLESPNFVH